ncbi:hypothetical protein CKAH01_15142 [Colletotrichum kahawae]|uniref:Uncharacterized protein n=1 Tax=Colletotrichum kahawae TaxID=34407 RepID=A0AAE0DBF5_COLKA|nr:hypothetical protein CKAH01_15142 [Colletotrichum kahawae]
MNRARLAAPPGDCGADPPPTPLGNVYLGKMQILAGVILPSASIWSSEPDSETGVQIYGRHL